jgi:hypothetical protein
MRGVAIILVALSVLPMAAIPCLALSEIQTVGRGSSDANPDPTPQQSKQRPRTRLKVHPVAPYRHTHSIYPVPYHFDYPGPNAKRECSARYVQEHRPSGTVVVSRMNCRWVRG